MNTPGELSSDAREIIAILRKNLPRLEQQYQVANVQIFGSFLRGGKKSAHDLDLLVEFRKDPSLLRFIALENELTELLGVKVDLVMKDGLKPAIGKRIFQEAVSL